MRALALVLAIWPTLAFGDDWNVLTGPEITTALSARELVYEDGTRQSFKADGATYFGDTTGTWRIDGDQYCSVWPPSDRWACYGVEVSGLDVRFVAADGSATTARYDDLN
jgi:hypothetical protein